MPTAWRLLPCLRQSADLPILLVKYEFNNSGYSILLTDLVHIWAETLDRRNIITRAFQEDTSIDPSEGSDQLKLLLDHIEKALAGGPDTQLILSPGDGDRNLILHVTSSLPAPLLPLLWRLQLLFSQQSLLAEELLIPSLSQLSNVTCQIPSLVSLLKEKDRVISKLIDKLKAAGIDIPEIFPRAGPSKSGSRSSDRGIIVQSVKGLAEFDEALWQVEQTRSLEKGATLHDICDNVFGGNNLGVSRGAVAGTVGEQWWRGLKKHDGLERAEIDETSSLRNVHMVRKEEGSPVEDFQVNECPHSYALAHPSQRQATPEQTPMKEKVAVPAATCDDQPGDPTTSESDDDLDAAPKKSLAEGAAIPTRFHPSQESDFGPPKSRRIGMLGGKTGNPQEPSSSSRPSRGLTQQSSDVEPMLDLGPHARTAAIAKPDGKFGRIGGKAHAASPNAGKITGATSPTIMKSESRGRELPSASKSPVQTRETSEERADRKRAELKRELDAKSKAPVKKKRKF
ncbi:hypothetical protein MMC09_002495 [Bachmanniomyces sp. S44760]|nr:hypothetical protein [Bachmanniomyces sp. S44760]